MMPAQVPDANTGYDDHNVFWYRRSISRPTIMDGNIFVSAFYRPHQLAVFQHGDAVGDGKNLVSLWLT
jgi:hypothetical protein